MEQMVCIFESSQLERLVCRGLTVRCEKVNHSCMNRKKCDPWGPSRKAVFTSQVPQKYHCRQSEMQACQQETRMTLSQSLCLIEIGRLMTVVSLPNSKWKWHLKTAISFSFQGEGLFCWMIYISVHQVEILNALVDAERSAMQYHLQKTSVKWSLLELSLRKTSEGPGCLEMQHLPASRGKGYGFYESTPLN